MTVIVAGSSILFIIKDLCTVDSTFSCIGGDHAETFLAVAKINAGSTVMLACIHRLMFSG